MERSLVWASLVLGCFGWLCATGLGWPLARTQAPPEAGAPGKGDKTGKGAAPNGNAAAHMGSGLSWARIWMAVAIPLVVWAVTLPERPPFSSGQGWGRGFLMGGLGALAGASALLYLAASVRSLRPLAARAAALAPLFAILPVVAVALLWMRGSIIDTLVGIATGWLVLSFALVPALENNASERDDNDGYTPAVPAAAWLLHSAAFAVTVCGASTLGVYRDFIVNDTVRGTYPAVALALATTIPFSLLCGALAWEIIGPLLRGAKTFLSDNVLSAILATLILLGLAYSLSMNLLNELHLLTAVGIGLAASLLMCWLVHQSNTALNGAADSDESAGLVAGATPSFAGVPPLAALVALCAFMLSYQVLQGFGVGLMVVSLWPVAILAAGNRIRGNALGSLTPLVIFLALLLMSRVFTMRWRADLRGISMADHYALFGLLFGVMLPAQLAILLATPVRRTSLASVSPAGAAPAARPTMLRFVLAIALALAAPGAMIALWGAKGTTALCIGLALGTVLLPQVASMKTGTSTNLFETRAISTCFFALFMALALAQWTHRLLSLADAPRDQRLHYLLWGSGALVVLLLLCDYGERIIAWMRRKRQPALPAKEGASP